MTQKKASASGTKKLKLKTQTVKDLSPKGKAGPKGGDFTLPLGTNYCRTKLGCETLKR